MKKDKKNTGKTNVDRYLQPGLTEKEVYNKMSNNFDSDNKKIDKYFDEFQKKRRIIEKTAGKFSNKYLTKVLLQGPTNINEFEKKTKKAFDVAAKKHNLPKEAYLLFLDMVNIQKGKQQGIKFTESNMAKMLGFTDLLKAGKLNVNSEDLKTIAKIKDLHAQTRQLFERSMLNSMSYTEPLDQVGLSTRYKYDQKPLNYFNHVHPVPDAFFRRKYVKPDLIILQSNLGYIIQCLEKGYPIQTEPDFELYKNLVVDISGVKSSKNAATDYFNRFDLQAVLWNESLCIRSGKVYNGRLDKFLAVIEKYRDNIYEAPNLAFVKDNASIARRIFNAFSYRPIRIQIAPMQHASSTLGPQGLTNTLSGLASGPSIGISNVTTIPILTVKINDDSIVDLSKSLNGYEWFMNNGMLVQVQQTILPCLSKDDIIIINTDRRQVISNNTGLPFTYGSVPAIQYSSGWETMAYGALSKFLVLMPSNAVPDFVGASVPGTTTGNVMTITDNGTSYYPKLSSVVYHHYKIHKGKKYVFGTASVTLNNALAGVNDRPVITTGRVYNPLGPLTTDFTDSNNNYRGANINVLKADTCVYLVDDAVGDAGGVPEPSLYSGVAILGIPAPENENLEIKIKCASSLLIYSYQA